MKQHQEDELTWEQYFPHLEARFTNVQHSNLMVQLKQLSQTSIVHNYIEAFDKLTAKVDISEMMVMNCFLGGLRPEIQSIVDAFGLTSLASMKHMARIQEHMVSAWCSVNTSCSQFTTASSVLVCRNLHGQVQNNCLPPPLVKDLPLDLQ